mgnify:CR=1 FL=1
MNEKITALLEEVDEIALSNETSYLIGQRLISICGQIRAEFIMIKYDQEMKRIVNAPWPQDRL